MISGMAKKKRISNLVSKSRSIACRRQEIVSRRNVLLKSRQSTIIKLAKNSLNHNNGDANEQTGRLVKPPLSINVYMHNILYAFVSMFI